MKREVLPEAILRADGVLDACSRKIDANLVNPTIVNPKINQTILHPACVNPTNTMMKAAERHEPVFAYAKAPVYSRMRQELRALRFSQSAEGKLLRKKREHLLNKVSMLENIGNPRFTAFSKRIHPLPKKSEVNRAWDLLAREFFPKKKTRLIDARRALRKCFARLDMPWRVEISPMVASASVMPSQRVLSLNKTLFTQRFVERLKVHEIGTHVVRAENGRLQPLSIFLHGLAGYLPTEEGLAAHTEERFGVLSASVLRTYAGRLVAVDLAKKHTYSELVKELSGHFSEQKAATLALRAKRGVADGGQYGGYTKDAAYLTGFWALKEYEARGGDFAPLYYGKVGLKDLPVLEKLDWLVPPKYHPDMLRKKQSNR